ncbi:nitroreductase [Burkholderia ambifaria]|uniref:Putative NAD(P)H nitroreductase n=1 Tax=Burkholderia ambifaria MEX-5 TaxID=396597 RepID=B1TG09_9BURK|nr:nitroreductase [Burkholderia ambifaria]EDT37494.1 nitroreductase [Burkholderia ambifaria MEX-5]
MLATNPLAPLLNRRSTPSRQLGGAEPEPAVLRRLLEAAVRVPDHGKLEPFRLILLKGAAKVAFGERLAARALRRSPDLTPAQQEKERLRYTFAPVVIAVIACIDADSSVPALEQHLSAGCVAYNLLLGASALGLGAQWLTGWAADDAEVAALLGLDGNERPIAFVHIGTPKQAAAERERPDLARVLSVWTPA